jgi:hypothetical protein
MNDLSPAISNNVTEEPKTITLNHIMKEELPLPATKNNDPSIDRVVTESVSVSQLSSLSVLTQVPNAPPVTARSSLSEQPSSAIPTDPTGTILLQVATNEPIVSQSEEINGIPEGTLVTAAQQEAGTVENQKEQKKKSRFTVKAVPREVNSD